MIRSIKVPSPVTPVDPYTDEPLPDSMPLWKYLSVTVFQSPMYARSPDQLADMYDLLGKLKKAKAGDLVAVEGEQHSKMCALLKEFPCGPVNDRGQAPINPLFAAQYGPLRDSVFDADKAD